MAGTESRLRRLLLLKPLFVCEEMSVVESRTGKVHAEMVRGDSAPVQRDCAAAGGASKGGLDADEVCDVPGALVQQSRAHLRQDDVTQNSQNSPLERKLGLDSDSQLQHLAPFVLDVFDRF